jgi:hypothetical protein
VHEITLNVLQVNWFILAGGLVFGIFYSIARIIPRHEE